MHENASDYKTKKMRCPRECKECLKSGILLEKC